MGQFPTFWEWPIVAAGESDKSRSVASHFPHEARWASVIRSFSLWWRSLGRRVHAIRLCALRARRQNRREEGRHGQEERELRNTGVRYRRPLYLHISTGRMRSRSLITYERHTGRGITPSPLSKQCKARGDFYKDHPVDIGRACGHTGGYMPYLRLLDECVFTEPRTSNYSSGPHTHVFLEHTRSNNWY